MLVGFESDERILPKCETCGVPMKLWHRLPRVKEPGWVQVFQCSCCERLTFLPEAQLGPG
jgi:hypothetical protein